MMKKVLHITLWLSLIAWLTLLTGFIAGKNDEVLCKRMVIDITDSALVKFIIPEAVSDMISEAGFELRGYPAAAINTRRLETMLKENPYVRNAEVYVNIEGEIRIDIEQRIPVVRIMSEGTRGFYIDDEGVVLPLSERYAPMVLPVTGYLELPTLDPGTRLEGSEVRDMMENAGLACFYELLDFVRYVRADPFWEKQFVQVYRDARGEYELIPRVGAHQILFGTMEDYREKLRNLRLLYEQGFGKDGWNSYSKINLKYSNQVICTKR